MDVLTGPAEQYASEEDREWTVGVLRTNHAAGRLTVTELEDRIRKAYAGRTLGDLRAVLANLPLPQPDQEPSPPFTPQPPLTRSGNYPTRRHRRNGPISLRQNAISYAVIMAFLIVVWLFSGMGYPWFIWPMLAWTVAVVAQAANQLAGAPRR